MNNLSRFLFPTDPATWTCPIQQGIPFLIERTFDIIYWVAALAFLFGVILAVIYYLTAFGNEDQAKKARQTLQWTLIGAVVVLLARVAVMGAVGIFAADGQADTTIFGNPTENCIIQEQTATGEQAELFNQFEDLGFEAGTAVTGEAPDFVTE